MGTIIWLVILGVVIVAGIIVAVMNRKTEAEKNDYAHEGRKWTRVIATTVSAVAAVIVTLIFGFGSFYSQGEGVSTVQVGFAGNVVTTTTDSGLKTKAPWDSIQEFNIRNQTIEMFENAGGVGKDGASISAPLDGGANASISITITYNIDRTKVESIYKDFGSQESLADSVLKPTLRDIVREASATYAPLAIKQERAKLGADIELALEEAWSPYGVTLNQVNLGDIQLDTATEEAISQVIAAQQAVERSRAELEQAQITAEQTKTEAQAAADADQIVRCGATTTYENRLVNGKDTQVQVVTPKPSSECEDRLNEQVLTTKYYDTLRDLGEQGNMIVVIPENGSAPIINLPAK